MARFIRAQNISQCDEFVSVAHEFKTLADPSKKDAMFETILLARVSIIFYSYDCKIPVSNYSVKAIWLKGVSFFQTYGKTGENRAV